MSEDRFTPARDWCPHPEYWHSVDSEATEDEVAAFLGALIRMIQPEFILETGTYQAYTTFIMAKALRANKHGRGVSIEKDTPTFRTAISHMQKWWTWAELEDEDPPIDILNMNSMDYIPDQDIDFAFFDSWQEGRSEEFLRYYKMGRLKKDAIVAFHDTAPHHQVRKYVLPLAGVVTETTPEMTWEDLTNYIQIIDFHTPRGLILGQVL